jgi:hypothetical protein
MKTSELQGAALDWAVAKCEGLDYWQPEIGPSQPDYSTDWAQGGPIIEREGIHIKKHPSDWIALPYDSVFSEEAYQQGPTPLIAAMRCYVASQLGDEVSIPEGLV